MFSLFSNSSLIDLICLEKTIIKGKNATGKNVKTGLFIFSIKNMPLISMMTIAIKITIDAVFSILDFDLSSSMVSLEKILLFHRYFF